MKRYILLIGMLVAYLSVGAQSSTITTTGTPYTGSNSLGAPANISFVVNNTNSYPIVLNGIGNFCTTADNNSIWELYYSATSLTGTSSDVTAAPWSLVGTSTATPVAASGIVALPFPNLSLVIPANTGYRLVLRNIGPGSTRYSGSAALTPNSFSAAGVELLCGDAQFSGGSVGYSGSGIALTLTPRYYTGFITFEPFGPCTDPPIAGIATTSSSTVCAQQNFTLSLSGISGGMGQTYQWQASPDSVLWSDITGATSASLNTTQSNPVTYYRCQLTCGVSTVASAGVKVTAILNPMAGGSYTVGGSSSDFPNLQSALDLLSCAGMSGSVNLALMQNDTGAFTLNNLSSAPGSVLSIAGGVPNVTLTNPGSSTLFSITQCTDISISNLIFERTGAPAAAQDLLFVSNSTNISIISNTFKGFTGSTSANNRLLHLSGVNTSVVQANSFVDGYYGIHTTAGTGGNANLAFMDNIVTDTYHTPVNITGTNTNTIISNNLISTNITISTAGLGINIAAGTSSTVTNNQILGTIGNYGIHLNNYNGDSLNPNIVTNNVIAADFTNTTPNAIRLTSSGTGALADYAIVAHNSILMRTATTSTTSNAAIYLTGGTVASPTCTGIKFFNNVIQAISTAASATLPANFRTFYISNEYYLNNILESNHNQFDVPNPGDFAIQVTAAATFATFTAWQTATGNDLNSQSGDPIFTNGSLNNLVPLITSPMNNAGTPLSYVTTDILGYARSVTTPDIGAYEIQMISNSVLALSIDTPQGILIPNTNQVVSASFINVGTNAVTSLQLNYKYGNNPTVTENWTGSLSAGATLSYSFTNLMAVGNPVGNQQLMVWSALPNGQPDADPTNDTLQGSYCLSLAGGSYTVGSPSSDFATLPDLITALNCAGISGPVTFNFEFPGNLYTAGNLVLDGVPGTSAINTLTLNGQGDTIRYEAVTGDRPVIAILNTDFVTVRNFVLQSSATGFGHGIYLVNANDVNIINNVIDLRVVTSTTVTGFTGILASTSPTGATATNFNRLVVDSNYIIGAGHGMRLFGTPTALSENIRITNNSFIDFYNSGVYLTNVDSAIVENNEISRPNRTSTTLFQGVNLEANTQGIIVRNNRIHNTHGSATSITTAAYGVRISANGGLTRRNQIYNNLIYNFQSTGNQNGILLNNADNVDIYFNSISLDDVNAASGAARGVYMQAHCRSINLLNNNISLTKGGTGDKQGIYLERDTTTFTSNHNNIYVNSNAGIQSVYHLGTTGYATLTDWQAAASSLYDQNSLSFAPGFANLTAGDLTPQNGVLNNAGISIAGITTDFTGAVRGVLPDIGALEFTPAGVDAGVLNVELHANGANIGTGTLCLSSATTQVVATVANTGIIDIDSIIVKYQLNNGAIITDTIFNTILSSQTYLHVFSVPAQLVSGANTLNAWTAYVGDVNSSNDTATVAVNIGLTTVLSVPHLDNFDSGSLPPSLCVVSGANANAEVLGTVGSTSLNISGSHSLVLSGNTAGTPWVTVNNTNWFLLNEGSQTYVDYFVDASSLQRLRLSFKLLQLYRAANSTNFRVLVNNQPIIPVGRNAAELQALSAASNTDTMTLVYDLDAFVGDTVKITLQSNVRYDYLGTPLSANIIDELSITEPAEARFDSITVITSECQTSARVINAKIVSVAPLTTVLLKYQINNNAIIDVPMTYAAGTDFWSGTIPAAAAGDTVRYYVSTTNSASFITNSDTFMYNDVYLAFTLGPDITITAGNSATLRANVGSGSAAGAVNTGVANNGSGAIMFDVMSTKNVQINAIDVYMSGSSQYSIDIYTKTGTFVGSESNAAAWTLLTTVTLTGAGTTTAVNVPLPIPINIAANQLHGIYMFGTGLRYIGVAATPATIGLPWASDSTLTVYGGTGGGPLFGGGANAGRTFAGVLHYTASDSLVWSDGVNILGHADTLVVSPLTTTTYTCTIIDANCSFTDTIVVNVGQQLPDVGISQIVSPTAGAVVNTVQPISVMIRNYGQIPATGFDVSYRVTPGTATSTNTILATIAPGDSMQYFFTESWTPTQGGNYTICAYTLMPGDNNSGNDTSCVSVSSTTSIEGLGNMSSRLYPNPARNLVTIELNETLDRGKLVIMDAVGRTVKTLEFEVGESRIDVNVETLEAGVYSYRIESKNKVAMGKFVKTK